MIAKFGLCEDTDMRKYYEGTFLIGCDNKRGEFAWMAPEIFEYFIRLDHCDYVVSDLDEEEPDSTFSITCDTWSLGCLLKVSFLVKFFFFKSKYLTDQIIENLFFLLEAMQASNHELSQVYELIRYMIEEEPDDRISLGTVVKELETVLPPSTTA
jgi:serine/threonine protein kinase